MLDVTPNGTVAVTAIHPGEHLAEELKELGMSAAGLVRKLNGACQPNHRNFEWAARHDRGHGLAPDPFLRHERGVLAKLAEPLRIAHGPEESGASNQRPSSIETL
jgi:hypothetical protein